MLLFAVLADSAGHRLITGTAERAVIVSRPIRTPVAEVPAQTTFSGLAKFHSRTIGAVFWESRRPCAQAIFHTAEQSKTFLNPIDYKA